MEENKFASLPTDEEVGKRIRDAYKKCGKTQEEVATAVKMSPSTLRNIENGVTSPTLKQLNAFADLLGVDATTFLNPPATDNMKKAIEQIEYNLLLIKAEVGHK